MSKKYYLVTGGAGFIGSNFVHDVLRKYSEAHVINLDKLTYAGNLDNLADLKTDPRHIFVKADVADESCVTDVFQKYPIDYVVNFAAETHVDRSIMCPTDFIKTDVLGAYVLLEAARKKGIEKFIQISTDEVYGSIENGSFKETDALMPRNPYSASKAGADRLAYSYWATYDLPVVITRASNNFGPYQYPEKFISLSVTNLIEGKKIPLYGDGRNIRDWLYVGDHCDAVDFIIHHGASGEVYNIGGENEFQNIEIAEMILSHLGQTKSSIEWVKDRPGHDRRYSLDMSKLRNLGWKASHSFKSALSDTLNWYRENRAWWEKIKSGEFKKYYEKQYSVRS